MTLIFLAIFVPVDLVIDKKIEAYYENKRES